MEAAQRWKKGFLRRWPLIPHVAAALGAVAWSRHVSGAMAALVLVAAAVYVILVDSRQRRLLRTKINRLQHHHPPPPVEEENRRRLGRRDNGGDGTRMAVEAWLNGVVGACWPAWEAGPMRTLLENKGRELLHRICGPNILLHSVRLGSSPPILFSASLPPPPPHRHDALILDFDLSFVADEDMGVVFMLQSMGYFTTKLFCDEVTVDCKVRIGLNFVAYSPYISSISISFLSLPNVDLSIRPLSSNGLAVTDLPMIATWVSNSIGIAIQACGFLHPNEFELNLLQLWGISPDVRMDVSKTTNDTTNLVANHGCYAILEILEGKNLMAKDLSGFSDPYVIVTQEPWELRLKTKTRKRTLNPTWRQCFTIPLPPAAPDFRYPNLLLRCRDRDLFVDDELGYFELDLNLYRDGIRHELACKLKDADSGELLIAVTVFDSSSPEVQLPTTRSSLRTSLFQAPSRTSIADQDDPSGAAPDDDNKSLDEDEASDAFSTAQQAMLHLHEIISSVLTIGDHEESGGGATHGSGRGSRRLTRSGHIHNRYGEVASGYNSSRRSVGTSVVAAERKSSRSARPSYAAPVAAKQEGRMTRLAENYVTPLKSGGSSSRRSFGTANNRREAGNTRTMSMTQEGAAIVGRAASAGASSSRGNRLFNFPPFLNKAKDSGG